ncbi:ABC transporter permease [Leifsonia sp. L25]|uniref:ABC transporter permease n=1 Tax=Actinomycetes TaxID=1760 RepID=UPI003D68F5E3
MSVAETATTDETTVSPRSTRARRAILNILSTYGTLIAMLILIVTFSIAAPDGEFLRPLNLLAILSQSALTAIIACGLTLVLVVGQFDLSIGYTASFAGVLVTGLMTNQGIPIPVAILITVAAGALIGLVNGFLVAKAGVNAVVATLGVGTVVVGLSFGYGAGQPIVSLPAAFTSIALGRAVFGIPNLIWLMVIVIAVLWILLNRTPLGFRLQATGANRHAAVLAGVRTGRVTIAAFVVAGICAAIAGTLLSSQLGSGMVSSGDGYLLDALAAVFLGSATLRDGKFHILGTLVGVLIVNIGFNGLGLVGTPTFFQYVFKGGILVFAVALATLARRFSRA